MYGTIKNGEFIPAPKKITIGNKDYYNPSNEHYAINGYLLKVDTPYPEVDETETPNTYCVSHFEQQEDKAVQVWGKKEVPQETEEEKEIRYNTRVAELIRRNSLYNANAVEALFANYLVNKEKYLSEFTAFSLFREKCKEQARQEVYGG